jgi:DMSO/TMAO reductase YedYZ molybdopterin-dependent catalytic subunit
MSTRLNRRQMLGYTVSAAALAMAARPLSVFGFPPMEEGATPVPFLTPQPFNPNRTMVQWEKLESWVTPNKDVYGVSHYGVPAKLDVANWQLEIEGLVKKPQMLSLAAIKARPRKEVMATLECSGNGSSPTFMGAVGNVLWAGTPLAPLLKECGFKPQGIEVVFFGADQKVEKVREVDFQMNFSRSLTREDAEKLPILIAYEMNGEPLPREHGGPLRLVVPGWYGIAWVKWLNRIEVHDRRFMSKYMAREYVTIRGEERNGQTIWRETEVTTMNVKSIVARVSRLKDGTIRAMGAAWTDGTPLKTVELQVDGGAWAPVTLDRRNQSKYCWTFWTYDWRNPSPGEHTLVSRASDTNGNVQPSAEDPRIKLKKTYWEANQQVVRKIKV